MDINRRERYNDLNSSELAEYMVSKYFRKSIFGNKMNTSMIMISSEPNKELVQILDQTTVGDKKDSQAPAPTEEKSDNRAPALTTSFSTARSSATFQSTSEIKVNPESEVKNRNKL